MSTLTQHFVERADDEGRTGHLPYLAKAKEKKPLTPHTSGFLSGSVQGVALHSKTDRGIVGLDDVK